MPKLSELIAGSAAAPKRVKLSEVVGQTGAKDVADEMTPLQRFGTSVDYGIERTGQGVQQLGERMLADDRFNTEAFPLPLRMLLGGARAGVRAGTTPEERAARLRSTDAKVAESGRLFDEGLGQFTSGKTGNVVGSVIATAPIGAPGKATTWLQTLGRGGLFGGLGAATQPVEGGDNFATQKATQTGLGALFGAGFAGGLRGLQSVGERLLPRNVTAQAVNASNKVFTDPKFAAEGEALAQRTGVTGLSPGAITGNKVQTMGENMARQSILSRDMAFKADQRTAQQIHDYIGGVIERVRKGSVSADEAGKVVQGTVKNGVSKLAQIRDAQAAKDYGLVRQMIGTGPSPIRPTALADNLQGLVDEFDGVPAQDASKIAGWAKQQISNLEPIANDLNKLLQVRRFWSKASAGAANIFENVNPGLQRKVAAQLVGAIDKDLERASMELPGNLGSALKAANANYSAMQKNIEAIEKSPLGRLLGDDVASEVTGNFNTVAGEKVVERIKGMTPSEVGMVKSQLEKWNPDAWAGVKRRVLEDALSAAEQAAPSEGANVLALRGNAFVNALTRADKDGSKLRAMFSGKEQKEITDAFNVIRRFGDKTGYNFSGTAPMTEAQGLMNSLKDLTFKGAANVAGSAFGARSIARLMLDSNGRSAVMKLARLPPQSRQAQEVAAYITALVAAPEAAEQLNGTEQQPQRRRPGQQYARSQ